MSMSRRNLGFAPVSTLIVFIVLTVCAVVSAFRQASPESPMPLIDIIVINEGIALLATLVYGIIVHFTVAYINRKTR